MPEEITVIYELKKMSARMVRYESADEAVMVGPLYISKAALGFGVVDEPELSDFPQKLVIIAKAVA